MSWKFVAVIITIWLAPTLGAYLLQEPSALVLLILSSYVTLLALILGR